MKWYVLNKTPKFRIKLVIFKLLFLSYMPTTLLFLFIIQIVLPFSNLCKNTRKSLNLQIWIRHIIFQVEGMVVQQFIKLCHSLQFENLGQFLVTPNRLALKNKELLETFYDI